MSDVTALRRPATGTPPRSGFGSAATSRPTQEEGLNPWPRGYGYNEGFRDSTTAWSAPVRWSVPAPPAPPPESRSKRKRKQKTGLEEAYTVISWATLLVVATVVIGYMLAASAGMFSEPKNTDFWGEDTGTSQSPSVDQTNP